MRIAIDLQGAQSASRYRGIGRYSLALAQGVARNAGAHEVWLLLNNALPEAIPAIRGAFAGLVPPERIRVFDVPVPTAESDQRSQWRTGAAERIREYVIGQIAPDVVLVTSLFEGYVDNAVTSVGGFAGGTSTAVVLYDLIPFLNPQSYLGNPVQHRYYERKIASLRNAGLLLSISDYSRQEAIDALGLDPAGVVAISTAIDPARFHPAAQSAEEVATLRARFRIQRKMVMYAPGGFDPRKNIDGLILAYAMLAPALRAEHQLVIASRLDQREAYRLRSLAAGAGLTDDELLMTDYVDDATLVALYRAAALFVFPSKHEGFGLPALEAMACGALVIGGNNTSLPEVIGTPEAMFDAADPAAISERMSAVLGDVSLQARLREHGRTQAAKFSWDATALRAVRALEVHAGRQKAAPPPAKRRLAFISPLPPERTGIADYAAQCLPALADYFDIELIVNQPLVTLPPELAHMQKRDVAWFEQHADSYDQLIYQFGNSPFHSHMFALLAKYPGVVVLHDFYLSNVLAYEQMTGSMPRAWVDALHYSHGYCAALASLQPGGTEQTMTDYPCNLAVLQDASAVIVHSSHALELARKWYGADVGRNWHVVPLPRSAPTALSREQARQALGIAPEAFLVCTFGFVDSRKQSHRLLEAWRASSLAADPRCELVYVGANHGGSYGQRLLASINAAGAAQRIRIAGWTDEKVYTDYLQAADVGVQLRSDSRGETSAAVLDCMNYGLATIANANGSMAALPADAIWKLDDAFALGELVEALETLYRESALRADLGTRAAALIATEQRPEHSAARYAEVLDEVWQDAPASLPSLLHSLGEHVPADEQSLKELARCLAFAPQRYPQPRQLLVDVTTIVRNDLGTGIERVVRMQLRELLRHERSGFRVEPVYLSDQNGRLHYRYAQHYACKLLDMAPLTNGDAELDVNPGDVYYAPDYAPTANIDAAHAGIYADWHARGVSLNFLIHDLLPVLNPEFFPAGSDQRHAAWLACIADNADRLVCISAAVANQMQAWMQARSEAAARRPSLHVVHHGADILPAAPTDANLSDQDTQLLSQLAAVPSFLMVGTIEPRKGHLQTLEGFEQLWRAGEQVNLVIVGNEGWKPLPDAERRTIPNIVARLTNHPELGKRLFWLKGVNDALLNRVYQASTCLMASSEGEGFGLPLIEAAHYGLPVIARDIPVFREVAQESAFYFSGTGAEPVAAAVRQWLTHHAAQTHPRSGTMRFATWRNNAQALLAILG